MSPGSRGFHVGTVLLLKVNHAVIPHTLPQDQGCRDKGVELVKACGVKGAEATGTD
jgi:hypothetical protein